jgi:hypothetical protein
VVITAPGVGRQEVKRATEGYLHPSEDGHVVIIDNDKLIVVSNHSIRPQPLVDFVLEQAAQHART